MRVGREARGEQVQVLVGAVRLVVGQHDPAGPGPAAQTDRVLRRRVSQQGLGGHLGRKPERVVDQSSALASPAATKPNDQ